MPKDNINMHDALINQIRDASNRLKDSPVGDGFIYFPYLDFSDPETLAQQTSIRKTADTILSSGYVDVKDIAELLYYIADMME